MRTIEVGPPDTSDVRTGTIWRMTDGERVHELLVMTPISEHVWNVAYWPEGMEALHVDHTSVSMMAAEVIALAGELIACPTRMLLDLIEQAMGS